MKRWTWLAAAAVAIIEIAILGLALSPRVSADYRDYFIARSSDCWPRQVSGRYRLGQPLTFRNDAAGRATIRNRQCGWLPPFEAGTYSVGDQARLRFAFATPEGPLMVSLVARGYVGPQRPRQRVPVTVNGVALDEIVFTDADPIYYVMTVPAAVVARDRAGLTLRFDFPDRVSPLAMGVNADKRELGFLLSDLTILPAP